MKPILAEIAKRTKDSTIPKRGQKGFQPVLEKNFSHIEGKMSAQLQRKQI